MGLLTRALRRNFLRLVGCVFCTPELFPSQSERHFTTYSSRSLRASRSFKKDAAAAKADDDNNNQTNNQNSSSQKQQPEEEEDDDESQSEAQSRRFISSMEWSSVLFDLLDMGNTVLDLIFAVKLTRLPDATAYAVVLMISLVVSRIVLFRGTYLLFRGGIRLEQSLEDLIVARSPKLLVALQLFYSLSYTETAAFLIEIFPKMAIYAYWRTINFPPAPFEKLDAVNVIFSVVLGLTVGTFLVSVTLALTAWRGYMRLRYEADTWLLKVYHSGKLLLWALAVAAVASFLWQVIHLAWVVTVLDRPELPSGELLWGWIRLCDDVTLVDRLSFCDEETFLIKTLLAWLLASYFCFYLFFRAAPVPGEAQDDPAGPDPTGTAATTKQSSTAAAPVYKAVVVLRPHATLQDSTGHISDSTLDVGEDLEQCNNLPLPDAPTPKDTSVELEPAETTTAHAPAKTTTKTKLIKKARFQQLDEPDVPDRQPDKTAVTKTKASTKTMAAPVNKSDSSEPKPTNTTETKRKPKMAAIQAVV